ncbi:PEGA domain-containing protein [Candidatus Gottesmanbacteria bacterium]|nr:PEGA domain-containing protein [Candidatus Gottesmanbacteria bacterium]
MAWRKLRDYLIPFVTIALILTVSFAIIAYGRGYRLDLNKTQLRATGLLSVTSDPIGAQVYVDGKLKTATNTSLNLSPGQYTIRITKEGYLAWEKPVGVMGEVVSRADAFLFPTNPSLSPLTSSGVKEPVLSPDGTKIAYIVPPKQIDGNVNKTGIWVLELAEGPLGRNRDPVQVASVDPNFDVTAATIVWSPDTTELLLTVPSRQARLYRTNRLDSFQDASLTASSLLGEWQDERNGKERQKLAAFKQPIINMATTSAKIISFSPDETKIFYEATASATIPTVINPHLLGTNATPETRTTQPGKLYVYDSREDRNYLLLAKTELPSPTPTPKSPLSSIGNWKLEIGNSTRSVVWLPTNKHLILTLPGKIDVMEYDRTNWITVYSGPFVEGFVAPWPNGSRLVVLTNLNQTASTLPNLYTVNLR